jgi:hypothetical protein
MRAQRSRRKTVLLSTWILTLGLGLSSGPEQAAAQARLVHRAATAPLVRADTTLDSRDLRLGQKLSAWVSEPEQESELEFAAVVDYGIAWPDAIEDSVTLALATPVDRPGVLALEFQDLDDDDEREVILEGRIASLDPGDQRGKGRDSQRTAVRRDVFVARPQPARTVIPTSVADRVRAEEVNHQPYVIPRLTPGQASILRRNAHTLARRWRNEIGVSSTGRLNPYRSYDAAELELHFALTGFAEAASDYDRAVRASFDVERLADANLELIAAARRVDAALRWVWVPDRTLAAWRSIRSSLGPVYFGYSG